METSNLWIQLKTLGLSIYLNQMFASKLSKQNSAGFALIVESNWKIEGLSQLLLSFQKVKKVIQVVFHNLHLLWYQIHLKLVLDCYLKLNLISSIMVSLLLFLIHALSEGKLLFYPNKILKYLFLSLNLSILDFLVLCLLFSHILMVSYRFQDLLLLVRAFDLLITFY